MGGGGAPCSHGMGYLCVSVFESETHNTQNLWLGIYIDGSPTFKLSCIQGIYSSRGALGGATLALGGATVAVCTSFLGTDLCLQIASAGGNMMNWMFIQMS